MTSFSTSWADIVFLSAKPLTLFKRDDHVLFEQAGTADTNAVGLSDWVPVRWLEIVCVHGGFKPSLFVRHHGRFLSERRLRAVAFPLALLLLVVFLEPLKGEAMDCKADQAGASKAEQIADDAGLRGGDAFSASDGSVSRLLWNPQSFISGSIVTSNAPPESR